MNSLNCPCECHIGRQFNEPIPLLYHSRNCCICSVSYNDQLTKWPKAIRDTLPLIAVRYDNER